MALSPKTKVTFATLPREIRDKVYKHMLTESKTINTSQCAADYGQPEDMGTLRATMHACRASPQFAREAFETFFQINTFTMPAHVGTGFLKRPVYYIDGLGFQPTMMFVKRIEIIVGTHEYNYEYKQPNEYGLRNCFHKLLACPALCYVTVKVEKTSIVEERILAELDIILTDTTDMYQKLKAKIGEGLKFETEYLPIGESVKIWEERVDLAACVET